ncbi:conserved protein of unknown function [Cyanobium sp. NIES-981]|nr:conserved protein of unknown function [Cyanobium sp. NIES-981]
MMSRFQATISTFAAIGTIGLTVVAVYRAVDDQKQRDLKNQQEIQALREQLEEQRKQEKSNQPALSPSVPAPTLQPTLPSPLSIQTPSNTPGPSLPPPPLPEPGSPGE